MNIEPWIGYFLTAVAMVSGWIVQWIKARDARQAAEVKLRKDFEDGLGKVKFDAALDVKELWKGLNDSIRERERGIAELKTEVSTLKVQMAIFWKDIADDAGRRLHRPHLTAKAMDMLLDEYRDVTLTPGRLAELKLRLREKALSADLEPHELLTDMPQRQADAKQMLAANVRHETLTASFTEEEQQEHRRQNEQADSKS
jgi:hypothetical protein